MRLMQRPADRSYYLEIRVRSQTRPNLIRIGIVNMNEDRRTRARVAAVAGALAEQLDELYGDRIEPSAVAATAGELYDDLMRMPVVEAGDEPSGTDSRLA